MSSEIFKVGFVGIIVVEISLAVGSRCAIAEKKMRILWEVFLRTSWPKTGTLEHPPQVCKNLQKVSITLGLIRGCALGPLEASALGGKTPAPNGKVR